MCVCVHVCVCLCVCVSMCVLRRGRGGEGCTQVHMHAGTCVWVESVLALIIVHKNSAKQTLVMNNSYRCSSCSSSSRNNNNNNNDDISLLFFLSLFPCQMTLRSVCDTVVM